MVAVDESSDEEGDGSEDDDASAKRQRSLSGDDLGDSFSLDQERSAKLGWIQEMLRKENADELESEDPTSADDSEDEEEDTDEGGDEDEEEGTDEGGDEFNKVQTLKDWEQSDEDELDTDLEEDDEEDDDQVERNEQKKEPKKHGRQLNLSDMEKIKSNDKKHSSELGELPYTIEAPKNFEEFTSLVEKCSDEQIVEVIRRIRAFNAITIAAENRKKMQVGNSLMVSFSGIHYSLGCFPFNHFP